MTHHIKRQSQQGRAIALFDAIATAEGLSIGTKTTTRRVLKRIGELTEPNPMLIHGKRVEAMFAVVAAALGKCALIHEEDVADYVERLRSYGDLVNRPVKRRVDSRRGKSTATKTATVEKAAAKRQP